MLASPKNDAAVYQPSIQERKKFWDQVVKREDGCWVFGNRTNHAYGRFFCRGVYVAAHRVSRLWFEKIKTTKNFACHRCTEKRCVRPGHLYFGTTKENASDRRRDGTQIVLRGDDSPTAKVTEKQARDIWALYHSTDMSASMVAKKMSLPMPLVHSIVNQNSWKHLSYASKRIPKEKMSIKKAFGDRHAHAKFTLGEIQDICSRLNKGEHCTSIARRHDVSLCTILRISKGERWQRFIRKHDIALRLRHGYQLAKNRDAAVLEKARRMHNDGILKKDIMKALGFGRRVLEYALNTKNSS